ncbi:hypothetical protein C8J57DRAFT_1311554, partial [Mycena rebaudengoi]
MCVLSFDRHHDLKRHRETHAGERPYLCNGGCGKTFTRKDALKRHQVHPSAVAETFLISVPHSSPRNVDEVNSNLYFFRHGPILKSCTI